MFSPSALGKYSLHRHPSCVGGHNLLIAGTEYCTMILGALLSRSVLDRYSSHWPCVSFPHRWTRPTDCHDFCNVLKGPIKKYFLRKVHQNEKLWKKEYNGNLIKFMHETCSQTCMIFTYWILSHLVPVMQVKRYMIYRVVGSPACFLVAMIIQM